MTSEKINLEMTDITGAEYVEIRIRKDGTVVWINTETHCVLRICQIKNIKVIDERNEAAPKAKVLFGGRPDG